MMATVVVVVKTTMIIIIIATLSMLLVKVMVILLIMAMAILNPHCSSPGSNYTVKTFTGDAEGSGTDAKVYITLYGEKGDSGFRKLKEGNFKKGM